MKRAISLFLTILILLSLAASFAYAEGSESIRGTEAALANAVSYSCDVDNATGKIIVNGTVNHDVMIKYADYTIKLYAIAPGADARETIDSGEVEALAQTPMTIKFTFTIKPETTYERYSKYAIVFRSEDGEEYIAGTPMYPSVSSDFQYVRGDRRGYKGVISDTAAISSSVGAGTVIVDVDLGRMLGDVSDAILYPTGETYVPFSKSYVEELDRRIMSSSVGDARIYLRFLLSAADERLSIAVTEDASRLTVPNVYDEYTLDYVSALSSFLCDRYADTDGSIRGVIMGERADDVEATNYIGGLSLEEYGDAYVLYLTVVATAMRLSDDSIDVVIPFSDKDEYSSARADGTYSSDFLKYVISGLEYSTSGKFQCSIMLQSDTVPFGITNENIVNGIDTSAKYGEGRIHADNISAFTNYVITLTTSYVSAPMNVIFMWEPPTHLRGSALNAAYAYTYYKLYGVSAVSAFVLDAESTEQLDELSHLMRYVDTRRADSVTAPLLEYFGAESWASVVGSEIKVNTIQTLYECGELSGVQSGDYKSSFTYYEFSDYNVFHNTHKGQGCGSIYSTHDSKGSRALQMSAGAMRVNEAAEITYLLDYSESFLYTPVISLRLGVEETGGGGLYEVVLTLGEGRERVRCRAVIEVGSEQRVFFDVSDFALSHTADYMKISIRPLVSDADNCTLWLYDLCGYSDEYTSEELDTLIKTQREDLRNPPQSDPNRIYRTVLISVCIVFVLVAVSVGLFMLFRRDEHSDKENKEG